MINRIFIILLNCLIFAGCGYIFSGTYEDDPDNWERVYNQPKPDNIEIIHSQFKRYPHFTYEFDFYIQIGPNADVIHGFMKNRNLKKTDYSDRLSSSDNIPAWFAPKPQRHYEIYVSRDITDNIHLFIDKVTGELFWNESQY